MFTRYRNAAVGTLCAISISICCSDPISAVPGTMIRTEQADSDQQVTRRDYQPMTVLRKPIRPIVEPDVVSADDAEVAENELVIGVVANGAARAYPINQLTGPQREIINDVLGETAIAATW